MAQTVKKKNPPAMREIWVWFLGLGRSPGEGNGNPLQYSCLERHKESDMTKWLYIHTHAHPIWETESCKLVVTSARKELLQGMYIYYPKYRGRQVMTCIGLDNLEKRDIKRIPMSYLLFSFRREVSSF